MGALVPRAAGSRSWCGSRPFCRALAEFGVELVCAEWSDAFMPVLEARCSTVGARAVQLDLTREVLNETFDLVFCTQVLLHIPPEQILTALLNLKQMIGGHAAIMTWQGKTIDESAGTSCNRSPMTIVGGLPRPVCGYSWIAIASPISTTPGSGGTNSITFASIGNGSRDLWTAPTLNYLREHV